MDVVFDGTARLIIINTGITEIAAADIYSWWKQWVLAQNANFLRAFSTTGGEPVSPTTDISAYFFLDNDWRLRPWEGDHQLVIQGNIFVAGGVGSIVVPTLGDYNVLVTSEVSPQSQAVSTGVGTVDEVKDAVWDTQVSEHQDSGTTGEALDKIDKNTTLIPGTL
ncbi:MAG: hypothetical protein GOV02_03165 [Candidatus Aenigmarchaeota archaeon]|nr:hypothetical protein [Candidatus Aenigmarchaeota archaeon]